MPVEVSVARPASARLQTNTYFIVAEALTNVVEHAQASRAWVKVELAGTMDAGGADAGRGTGLTGLLDRVEAVGGKLDIHSPTGRGTTLRVTLIEAHDAMPV